MENQSISTHRGRRYTVRLVQCASPKLGGLWSVIRHLTRGGYPTIDVFDNEEEAKGHYILLAKENK